MQWFLIRLTLIRIVKLTSKNGTGFIQIIGSDFYPDYRNTSQGIFRGSCSQSLCGVHCFQSPTGDVVLVTIVTIKNLTKNN